MAERQITIRIIGDSTKASKAFADVGTSAGTLEAKVSGLGSKFGTFSQVFTGFMAAGAVQKFGGWLKDGAQGAADDAAAMDRLETAVTNTGAAYETYAPTIEDVIKRGQDLAFTDGETAEALALLTSLTGDTDEAMRRLTTAQDLARGTGMSLVQASTLLGKVSDENISVLARYGITVKKGSDAQDVMNIVDQKFKGQAATFAEGDAGKWLKFQQQLGEVQEAIGGMLIPALSGLIAVMASVTAALDPVIQFIGNNFIPIVLGLAAAILTALIPAAIAAATTLLTVTIPALAATVLAMAPLILTAVAVGLVVAALYLAWQSNFLGIRDITQQVIDFVLPYITTAMSAIQTVVETVWPVIAEIVTTYINILRAEIEIALAVVTTIWNTVFPAIRAVIETVFPVIAAVVTTWINVVRTEIDLALAAVLLIWNTVFPAIQALVETVMPIVSSIVETGLSAIRTAVDTVLVPVQGVFQDVFDTIRSTVDTAFNAANGVLRIFEGGVASVKTIIDGAKEGILSAWGAVTGGIQSAIEGIVGPIRGAVNSIIGALNAVIGAWNSLEFSLDSGIPGVPDINVGTPNVPLIPLLATGARNFPGGLALVGERGPELVNLPRGSDVFNAAETRGMRTRAPSPPTTINLYLAPGDATPLVSWVSGELGRATRRAPSVMGGS